MQYLYFCTRKINGRKTMVKRYLAAAALLVFSLWGVLAEAAVLKGKITDKSNNEPLIGASVQVAGTSTGGITDFDGNYSINVAEGETRLEIRYMGYETLLHSVRVSGDMVVDFALAPEGLAMDEIQVTGRRSRESEATLAIERRASTVAVESVGAKELKSKGVSNVEEGVKKVSGISIADAGMLVVRGLGDRYSTTTLNGLPIASPNPDNKLIPLDLFPVSVISNISVNKTYEVSSFADYSGAHIDIETREHTGEDYVTFELSTGSTVYTLGQDFYLPHRKGSMFVTGRLPEYIRDASPADFDAMVKESNIFGSDFSIDKTVGLPDIGFQVGTGQTWNVGDGKLSLVASASLDHQEATLPDGFITTLDGTGEKINHFAQEQYKEFLNATAMASLGYRMNSGHSLNYSVFYARNAESAYSRREGFDAEGVPLIGSNSIFHVYSLLNNQLQGKHKLGDRWDVNWNASFGYTTSDEPDRKQVMFRKRDDGSLSLFRLNAQETMRYYGELSEWEAVGDVNSSFKYGRDLDSRLHFGLVYKQKSRDYRSTRFYYNLRNLPDPQISDIYNTDGYLNQENIQNGAISVVRDMQPKDTYGAFMRVAAAYVETDYLPVRQLTLNVGLRLEYAMQHVDYYTDGGIRRSSDLNDLNLFPALNVKYALTDEHVLRFAASRTVTRPSFIEMAPFLYQESYGGIELRGNADLKNGYNYNFDLKYEFYLNEQSTEFVALTGYYKHLLTPIERVQESSGGSAVHSFRNSERGMAAGFEVELRKNIVKDLKLNVNFSYMYTNVKLPEGGGIYTSDSRALQGASPYLANADLSYTPSFGENRRLSIALLYNLQGPRIHAVGIMGLGDVRQRTLHTLNFAVGYEFNRRAQLKLQVDNLLNSDIVFDQFVPYTGETLEVERERRGLSASISFSYTLYND